MAAKLFIIAEGFLSVKIIKSKSSPAKLFNGLFLGCYFPQQAVIVGTIK